MTAETLRKSILQEAIQGKLVCQNKNEGTGKELFFSILDKKNKQINNNINSKEKYFNTVSKSKTEPFDIPESWYWCCLGDLVSYQNGYSYTSTETSDVKEGYPVIKSNNLMTLTVEINSKTKFVKNPSDKMLESLIKKGDLLMCLSSQSSNPEPLGKTALYNFDYPALLNQRVLKLKPLEKDTTLYLYYCINSQYFHYNVSHQGEGSAQANLKLEHVLNMQIPLPPLEEQKRIVKAIENYLEIVFDYKKVDDELSYLNNNINSKLKKAVLEEGLFGKLTEDWRSKNKVQETGQILLSNLLTEKKLLLDENKIMRKSPTIPFFTDEELAYFGIPDTWTWAQLSDVSIIQEGAGIRKWQYRDNGIQILCVTNILDNAIDLDKKQIFISEEEYKEKYLHLTLNKGDIVTSCSGGSWGKIAFFDKEDTIMLNTSTLRLRFWNDLADNNYLYYVCQSNFFKNQLLKQLSGMQPNFGYAHYSRIMIPLPPLLEQKEIVKKIETLLPICNSIGNN